MSVDCYKLELSVVTVCLPKRKRKGGSVAAATVGLKGKKMKGFLVNWWSKKYLGFSLVELGRILDGLQVKLTNFGASGAFATSDPALNLGPGLPLDQGLVRSGSLGPNLDLDLGLGLDLGLVQIRFQIWVCSWIWIRMSMRSWFLPRQVWVLCH
jgi:hypothetical protein